MVGEYEVFLSFRGIDTRKGFTDFLYNNLVDAGIRTFRDDDELPVGEEIRLELKKAIEESKICIPIFSQNYASSKWCLLELAHTVDCKRRTGQKIKPIFYDVKPRDVRHQTGSYKEAFRQHEERFDKETVQRWKEALKEVGELKGWDLKNDTNGRQGELIKIVVTKVLLALKKNYMVADNLVGIDHHIEEMKRLLNVHSNDVQIVGIHGIGGIGKTTIAKDVYNKLSECFDCCCFLADVRKMSQQNSDLVNLQKQLISKIRKGIVPDNANVDEGINMIKGMACNKKVLIVLDDVDEKSQFAKLVGKRDWFGSQSRIIVTTRDKKVLNDLGVDKMYEPNPMKADHALQLFSRHAFRSDSPPEGYHNLSKEIVSTTGGLPLALESIGSFFCCERRTEVWEETLKKLRNIPDDLVQRTLRISYEALKDNEKQIFLDIACFFIGENKTLPFYMWNDCECYPISGIDALVLKSLVKIGDDNEFRMHDQLRDLGREIVREENNKNPGERSRLWRYNEALEILERQTGTEKVEALYLQKYVFAKSGEHSFTNNEFGKLPNLRFLQMDCTDLTGDFKNLLSELRWLQWRICTDNSKPINFHLKNLVILDLSRSCITENWEGWSQIKMPKKLKVLNLSYCEGLTRTPDLSDLVMLKQLCLHGCRKLVDIRGLTGLTSLENLDMTSCASLERLPNLSNLVMLKILHFSHSRKLVEVGGLGDLKPLEMLFMSGCDLFEGLLDLSNLKNLKRLSISALKNLIEVQGLEEMESLEILDICGCRLLEKSLDLSNLKKLRELKAGGCENLPKIWGLEELESLEILYISGCRLLEKSLDLSNLQKLRELKAGGCENIPEIRGLQELESLEILDICGCRLLKKSLDLSKLKKLRELKAGGCENIPEIRGLEELESLEILDICGCRLLGKSLDLSNLKKLRELKAGGCENIPEIWGLEELESLEILDICGCRLLGKSLDLSNLKKLRELKAGGCENLREIRGLEELESLEILDICGCRLLKKSLDLSNLKKLRELKAGGCENIPEIRGLQELKSIKFLDICGCRLLEKSLDLSNLKKLRELKAGGCENLTEIRGLEELESLEILDICGCRLLEKSLDLSNLKKLEELKAGGCENIPEIWGLEELESLEILDIRGCRLLEKSLDLSNLQK